MPKVFHFLNLLFLGLCKFNLLWPDNAFETAKTFPAQKNISLADATGKQKKRPSVHNEKHLWKTDEKFEVAEPVHATYQCFLSYELLLLISTVLFETMDCSCDKSDMQSLKNRSEHLLGIDQNSSLRQLSCLRNVGAGVLVLIQPILAAFCCYGRLFTFDKSGAIIFVLHHTFETRPRKSLVTGFDLLRTTDYLRTNEKTKMVLIGSKKDFRRYRMSYRLYQTITSCR